MCQDAYEISTPLTIGGPSGTYVLKSPYNTECEWTLIELVTHAGLAIPFSISQTAGEPTPVVGAASAYGKLSSGSEGNAFPGMTGYVVNGCPITCQDTWFPLGQGNALYMTVTPGSTDSAYAIFAFRRRLEKDIPEKPRPKPHTHSHVKGRRQYRTMMEGFAAQFPEEGIPYEHQQLQPQDTEMGRRGVSPLQQLKPTNNQHRGVSRGRTR